MAKMFDPRDVQSFLREEFGKVGATARATSSSVTITSRGSDYKYKLPEPSENRPLLPGWFAAGIWDDLGLPSAQTLPDEQLLIGWGFTKAESSNYEKMIGAEKLLIYNAFREKLFIQNAISRSSIEVGDWPTKSVFHAQQLFDENGFFPESEPEPMHSQEISAYRI